MGQATWDSRFLPESTALSEDETRALFLRYRSGDSAARETLIESNLRLVAALVRRFPHVPIDPADLFQSGCAGLIRAVERFDPERGVRFSTFAVPAILGEIRQCIAESYPFRRGRRAEALLSKARALMGLEEGQEWRSTVSRVSAALGVTPEELVLIMQRAESAGAVSSLDEPLGGAERSDTPLSDRIAGAMDLEEAMVESIAVRAGLEEISPIERTVVVLRFFCDCTQAQVARRLRLSQAQVSRIESCALKNLRRAVAVP